MRRISHLAVAVLVAAPLAIALAQNPNPQNQNAARPNPTTRPGAAGQDGNSIDAHFAACLTLDNQAEVAMAEFAQGKAKHEKVKEFARKMIEDHTKFISDLKKFNHGYPGHALKIETTSTTTERREGKLDANDANRRDTNRDADDKARENDKARDNQADNKASDKARDDKSGDDKASDSKASDDKATVERTQTKTVHVAGMPNHEFFMKLKRELAQECLNDTARELASKSDKEFDQCYVTQQAMAHSKMVSELKVMKRHASPALQSVLADGLQTAEMHLKHAKDLVKTLDDDTQTARGEGKTKTE